MTKSQERKSQTLGMAYSTARSQLYKELIFALVKKSGDNVCYRCGGLIESSETFSVDHIVDWLYKEKDEALSKRAVTNKMLGLVE